MCVQDAVEQYCRSSPSGVTRVVIAHRLSTIRSADIIAFMREGEVVETGTHDVCLRLIASPMLSLVGAGQEARNVLQGWHQLIDL